MVKSGRAMYDWPNGKGGIPPTVRSIKIQKEKLSKFVNELLGQHFPVLKPEVAYHLVANGLRFWDQYIDLMMQEPRKEFDSLQKLKMKNIFVNQVRNILFFIQSKKIIYFFYKTYFLQNIFFLQFNTLIGVHCIA